MRKKILAANWKMNLTQAQAEAWLQEFKSLFSAHEQHELRIYPSAIYLKEVHAHEFHAGAQNFYFESEGAFTGELSLAQLQSIGVSSVLIGHSERRHLFHENTTLIAEKIKACARSQMPFVLCCGESSSERESGQHLVYIEAQLKAALQEFKAEQHRLLTIAYEPIWAIGSGSSATADQITEMHQFIRQILETQLGPNAHKIPVIYGGSVSFENAADIFSCPSVDGALVGGASLDPQHFYQLWQALSA
jgi:triosephosphate isomerase (TIM)